MYTRHYENTEHGNNNHHHERLSLKSKTPDFSFLFDLPDSGVVVFQDVHRLKPLFQVLQDLLTIYFLENCTLLLPEIINSNIGNV